MASFIRFMVLVLAGVALALPALAADSVLIEFELKDQFKFEYHEEDFRGKVLLVMVGNKKGGKFARTWSEHLQDSIPEWGMGRQVRLVSVADVGGVPFFLKGMIRGKMPKEPHNWILMDWGSKFHKAYDCEKDVCNLLYFDADSRFLKRTTVTDLTDAGLQAIQAELAGITGIDPLADPATDTEPPASTDVMIESGSSGEVAPGADK